MATKTCGCDVVLRRMGTLREEYAKSAGISQCPLHAAAPEMLATLKNMRSALLRHGGDPMPTLDALIAKAEAVHE